MFKVIMRGGQAYFDDQFREILIETIAIRRSGIINNEYDRCIMKIEDMYFYENEEGEMVPIHV